MPEKQNSRSRDIAALAAACLSVVLAGLSVAIAAPSRAAVSDSALSAGPDATAVEAGAEGAANASSNTVRTIDFASQAGQRVTDLKLPLQRHENGRVKELFLAREASIDEQGRFCADGGMRLLLLDDTGATSGVARAVSGWYDRAENTARCEGPVFLDLLSRGVSLAGTNLDWRSGISLARLERDAVLTLRRGGPGGAPSVLPASLGGGGRRGGRPRLMPGAAPGDPTTIASDSLEFDYANMVAVFDGHAVATDPEFILRADRMVAIFEGSNEVRRIDCIGRVTADGADGARIECARASYTRENGRVLLSGSPVVKHQGRTLRGDEITLWLGDERVVARPNARIDLPAGSVRQGRAGGAGGKLRVGGFGGSPIRITAQSMEYFYNLGSAVAEGGVTARDDEFTLESDKALMLLDEARRLKRFDCDGRVRARGRDMDARCGHATYTAENSLLSMTQDPSASQLGRTIRGDVLRVDLAAESAEAVGNALVEARPDSFRTRRPRPPGTPASTLSANRILYFRRQRKAEARGKVVAADPEATLMSDEADAFFTADDELSRIEADGNVDIRVTDPEPEKGAGDILATSAHATYDRVGATATLTGDPLVRRGTQAIRGEPLFIDLEKMSVSAKGFAGRGELPSRSGGSASGAGGGANDGASR